MAYEINILYYVKLFNQRRKAIMAAVLIFMFLGLINSLRSPVMYVSTVTLIMPTGLDMTQSAGSQLANMLGLADGSGKFSTGGLSIDALLYSKRMGRDINNKFNLNKHPGFSYSLIRGRTRSADSITVRGTDAELTQKIANFVVENLDNLNSELKLSSQKPLLRVLDYAELGATLPRETSRKVITFGMFGFLSMSFFLVAVDYLRKLRDGHAPPKT